MIVFKRNFLCSFEETAFCNFNSCWLFGQVDGGNAGKLFLFFLKSVCAHMCLQHFLTPHLVLGHQSRSLGEIF